MHIFDQLVPSSSISSIILCPLRQDNISVLCQYVARGSHPPQCSQRQVAVPLGAVRVAQDLPQDACLCCGHLTEQPCKSLCLQQTPLSPVLINISSTNLSICVP